MPIDLQAHYSNRITSMNSLRLPTEVLGWLYRMSGVAVLPLPSNGANIYWIDASTNKRVLKQDLCHKSSCTLLWKYIMCECLKYSNIGIMKTFACSTFWLFSKVLRKIPRKRGTNHSQSSVMQRSHWTLILRCSLQRHCFGTVRDTGHSAIPWWAQRRGGNILYIQCDMF